MKPSRKFNSLLIANVLALAFVILALWLFGPDLGTTWPFGVVAILIAILTYAEYSKARRAGDQQKRRSAEEMTLK